MCQPDFLTIGRGQIGGLLWFLMCGIIIYKRGEKQRKGALNFDMRLANGLIIVDNKTIHDENYTYILHDDNTCSLSGVRAHKSIKDAIIPDEVDGYKVTEIGVAAFRGRKGLSTVIMGKNVKRIWQYAFYDCSNLYWVNLKNVEFIREFAFGRTGLQTLAIPSSINKMGEGVFYDCRHLISLEWNTNYDEIPPKTFMNCKTLVIMNFSNIYKVGSHAFDGAGLKSLNLRKHITRIDKTVFRNCSRLLCVSWNCKLSIGSKMFAGCGEIKQIRINSEVRSIAADAFSDCPKAEVEFA